MSKPPISAEDYTETLDRSQPLKIAIPTHLSGMRLDLALAELLPRYSRSRLQTWITDGAITLDGEITTPKSKVWGGEQVQVQPIAHP